jgi:uncharacterized protein YacL
VLSRTRTWIIGLCSLAGGVIGGISTSPLLSSFYLVIQKWMMTEQEYQAAVGNRSLEHWSVASNPATIVGMTILGLILGGGLGNFAAFAMERLDVRWRKMEAGDRVTLFVGIFAGIVAALPFLFLFQALGTATASILTFGFTLGFSALAVYALSSMEEVLPWQRSKGPTRKSGIKILDTNVIIDGRIYDVTRAGFLDGQIYVPNFVLDELQHIADSADPLRRQRGRRGLDVLRHMQADFSLEVGTRDRFAVPSSDGVDGRLVRLAQALGADIVTNDFNLNRVAALQDVRVLNINDLALALKPNVLPGESLALQLVREGNQPGQGVGYLDDGTMVVVEQGKRHIGETVHVTVTQVIQTERGKMIFGDLGQSATESGRASGGGAHSHQRS